MTIQDPDPSTRVIPIGGVGEFGANATIVQTASTTVLVDFGLMFPPDSSKPGVDFYINDIDLLETHFPKLDAVFLTHGHEDHIGGLSFLLRRFDVPLITLPYTVGIIRKSMSYYKDIKADLRPAELNQPVTIGDIEVEFVGVTHSIIQACALSIKTPGGHLVHTGDFKVDPLPGDNHPFQSKRFAELGEMGVDLLIMDSTNATKTGFCPSDYEIVPNLKDLILNAQGRVFLTTFSSHMPRIKKLKQVARQTGRKIIFIGRSFQKHFQLSLETSYMALKPDLFADVEDVPGIPDDQIIFVVTGSQAEQRSALSRISKTGFKGIRFKAGDLAIFSSKTIPGNERRIGLLTSHLQRDGVKVIVEKGTSVHTSGHGYQEDIAYMLALTKPRIVAPIHGEFHQLLSHHSWLQTLIGEDQRVLFIEDGDVVTLCNGDARCIDTIETRLTPIDGNQNLPIPSRVISERKDMMYSGLLLINAHVRPDDNYSNYEVVSHGVVETSEGACAKVLTGALQALTMAEDATEEAMVTSIRQCLKKTLRRFFVGRPFIKLILNGHIVR